MFSHYFYNSVDINFSHGYTIVKKYPLQWFDFDYVTFLFRTQDKKIINFLTCIFDNFL